ncbi:hypothetical protein GL305_20540, partial [Nocardia seriolae]|nr:hypothetical protein [Nocardia seriolae]MTJ88289.1 hypothetical protein [Nocardia seriolae]MTK32275.1 hypothetical protein [Nocardia seriolae]MTK48859.1 hypothetical protein [Nocardia seriolae]
HTTDLPAPTHIGVVAVLIVTAAGANACLALQSGPDANLGMVASEMNRTVRRVGAYLCAAPRRRL